MADIANVWALAAQAFPVEYLEYAAVEFDQAVHAQGLQRAVVINGNSNTLPHPPPICSNRYLDLLNSEFERIATEAERTHSVGGIGANVGAVHA